VRPRSASTTTKRPLTGPAGTTADASSTSADVNLFDAERVEVLRGPQGTLYGSGSMGGTLRVILNKPDSTKYSGAVEAQGTATHDGGTGYSVKGMVNVPLIEDKLAARLVLYEAEQGGYIDDVLLKKKDINDQHSTGGRLMLGFTPTDDITINASGLFQKTTLDGQNSWYRSLGEKDYSTNARVIAPTEDNLRVYNVTGKWELGFATLTGTSSYYKWTLLRNSDYSPTLSGSRANATSCRNYIAGGPPATGTAPACTTAQMAQYTAYADSRTPGALYQPMGLTSWNHELRMNGSLFADKIDWTAGVYYEDRSDYIESEVAKADAATGIINPSDLTAWRHVGTETKQTAFFGEITYKPIEKLSLTGGIRRFNYDKTVSGQVLISNFITQSYVGPAAQVDASADGWVSKVNVSYQVTSDVMVYGLAAKGFRPGGANNIPGLATALLAYQPDSLWNYEAGVKSQWFDRRLTVNAAAYQIDWSNMQISATSANGAFSYLTNAGKARIKGFEIEAIARPMRGLTLNATAAFVDAKLTEDQANSTILITGSTGLRGDEFPNVADFSGSAAAEYTWPITGDLNGLAARRLRLCRRVRLAVPPDLRLLRKAGRLRLRQPAWRDRGRGLGRLSVRQQRRQRGWPHERHLGGQQQAAGCQHQPPHGRLLGSQAVLRLTPRTITAPEPGFGAVFLSRRSAMHRTRCQRGIAADLRLVVDHPPVPLRTSGR
jgi:iron complex outermembrane receptor protein